MIIKHEKQVYKLRTKQNRFQWDRTVVYKFFSLMRVRNAHYLPWWALCNSASSYSCGSSSPIVFSGQSITKNTFLRKLLTLNVFSDIQKKSTDTLCASGSFGVKIFDNSQNMQSLKFQRFGRSSAVTLTNYQCFGIPVNTFFPSTNISHKNHVHITYHNKIIPSPHRITTFESIPTNSANIFERDSFPKDDTSIDVSGDHVEAYANLVMESCSIQKLQRLI